MSVSGRDFEQDGLTVARAIYDPTGVQGAIMFGGKERDGVFVSETAIVAFEFTQMPTKVKATKDGNKLAELLGAMMKEPENRFKSAQGYFVTEQDPTADQRTEIASISRRTGVPLKSLSLAMLRKQLVDAPRYLELRRNAPFGSTAFAISGALTPAAEFGYVQPTLVTNDGHVLPLENLLASASDGERFVINADFGAGKSEALRQGFEYLRNRYLRRPSDNRFPVHINLRDCYGLRTPTEVLTRHAGEVGFGDDRGLIAAWRSGDATLLLDGFDEIVPARWGGGARDLRSVRWQALGPVRRLIAESPADTGVVIVGRPQYFADRGELLESLGLNDALVLTLQDFDDAQLEDFLGVNAVTLPEWLPTRPLLVRSLAQVGMLEALSTESPMSEAECWSHLLTLLAQREADRIAAVPPERVRELIARIATVARSNEGASGTGMGEVSVDAMKDAFRHVCGYEADDEGIQLLLRLPGLASAGAQDGSDVRQFVDQTLAEASYGVDLARYVASPYQEHPLRERVSWPASTGNLAPAVANLELTRIGFPPEHVIQSIEARLNVDAQDAILFDLLAVAEEGGVAPLQATQPLFRELLVADVQVGSAGSYISSAIFRDCVIERLALDDVESDASLPLFERCLIGAVSGIASMPNAWTSRFPGCEISDFEDGAETTAAILDLELPRDVRLALMILKKVYAQAGSGRKMSGLVRGVPRDERGAVSEIVEGLVNANLLIKQTRRSVTLLLPAKGRRVEVLAYLDRPSTFDLP